MSETDEHDELAAVSAVPVEDMADEPASGTARAASSAGATGDGAPRHYGARPGGGRREGGRERGGYGRRRVCAFCMDNVQYIDYKDTARLRRFLSERGKIEPRRKTGTCAKHQRWLTTALQRARELALLPYTAEHVHYMGR